MCRGLRIGLLTRRRERFLAGGGRRAGLFPRIISLAILYTLDPSFLDARGTDLAGQAGIDADAVKRIEVQRGLSWLARPLLYLVGYGPLLCAITAAAYVEEARGSALVWEKTEKLGAVGDLA